MTKILTNKTSAVRRVLTTVLVLGAVAAQANQAGAVSLSVQYACMGDYFRYCSAHDVDSPALRRCMSSNGHRLTTTCVNALVKAGEVSQAEVDRRAARAKSARAR